MQHAATIDLVAEFGRAKESSAGRPAMSVPRARQLHFADQRQRQRAAEELTARGDRAKATGNQAAAKVYFESAKRQGDERAPRP